MKVLAVIVAVFAAVNFCEVTSLNIKEHENEKKVLPEMKERTLVGE